MNEVTKIHLGHQAFTIAVDAHKTLRAYLDAIKEQVRDKEVVDEVELRMAELLAEHGVTGDKVILPKDVEFLKAQLGDPKDFGDDSEPGKTEIENTTSKRLFRDSDNGILAGVSSGLANYFGIDVWIIRILFVIGVFTGGWGVLLYIALWLVVPEAKTPSEHLQMFGKPVTVSSLKDAVARADVAGAAKRANTTLAGPVNSIFHVLLKIVGLGLIVVGLSLVLAFITIGSYVLLHSGMLFGQDIFPVGLREHMLLNLGVAVAALCSIFVILLGIAIFKQRWPIKPWVTGTLIGLILVGFVGSAALGVDAAPQIRDRYNAHFHTTVRTVQPFTSVKVLGDNATVRYQETSNYAVSFKYFDNPNVATIKTTVSNGTLIIDASQFDNDRHCNSPCIPDNYALTITVDSPTALTLPAPRNIDGPIPPKLLQD